MIDGPAMWSASYTQYLLRASQQSTRASGLYYGLLQRISRGEVTPAMLQDALSALVEHRGRAYTERVSALSAQFFLRLVQVAGRSAEAPLPFDSSDPIGWWSRFAEYAMRVSHRLAQDYQADLARAAGGDADAPASPIDAAGERSRRAQELVQAMGALYFDLLSGLADAGADLETEYLTSVLRAPHAAAADAPVLELSGPVGEPASVVLSLENTRNERAVLRCTVSDVRRADGVGPAFAPDVVADPDGLMLEPNQEASVRLSLTLQAGMFEPGAPYVGSVHIVRYGEPRLDVPLRIVASPQGSS